MCCTPRCMYAWENALVPQLNVWGKVFLTYNCMPRGHLLSPQLHAMGIMHWATITTLQLHTLGGCSNPCQMTRSTVATSSFRCYPVKNGDFYHWSCLSKVRKVAPKNTTCSLGSQKCPQEVQLQTLCKFLCVQPPVPSEPHKSQTGRGEEVRDVIVRS